MEKSVVSAIEKIKLQEQGKEAKLKEKREVEGTIASLNRDIRDTIAQAEKANQESIELIQRTDRLQAQLDLEIIQRDALVQQLEANTKELNELRAKCDEAMAEVWELRSTLSKTVQSVSDVCDVWPLLTKPMYAEHVAPTTRPSNMEIDSDKPAFIYEGRLKEAAERRERALAERSRLQMEPDEGEEFVRIRNALKYSFEMASNLRKAT